MQNRLYLDLPWRSFQTQEKLLRKRFWTPPAEKIATLAAKMNASLQQFLPVNSINSSFFGIVKSIEHARDYLQPSTENAGSLYSLRSLLFVHLRFISVWVRFSIIRPGWLIYVLRAPCWGLNPGHPRSLSFSFWRTALPRREFTKQKHVDSTVIPRNGAVCSFNQWSWKYFVIAVQNCVV